MLAKLTSKNQLTLPKGAIDAVGEVEYFDVGVREGQIVLTPVRIQRADAVRAKLAQLGLTAADMADAVRWARAGGHTYKASEPPAEYARKSRPATAPKPGKNSARPK